MSDRSKTTMPRTLDQWRNMIPEAVVDGSPAQVLHCVTDAQITILAQARQIDRLHATMTGLLAEWDDGLDDPFWNAAREALKNV